MGEGWNKIFTRNTAETNNLAEFAKEQEHINMGSFR
jgi:hypothetical protein